MSAVENPGRPGVGPPERAKFAAAGEGDVVAITELIEEHRGLAVHLASRYRGRGEPDDELAQIALIALYQTILRFDPDRGVSFSSFAVPTIVGALRRHFRDHSRTVRLPRRVAELAAAGRAVAARLEQEDGVPPQPSRVAGALGVPEDELLSALDATRQGEGLDDSAVSLAEDDYATVESRLDIYRLLSGLPEPEQVAIRLSFFEERTQSEIASVLGVSQMQVSRLLRRGLLGIRDQMAS